MKAVFLDRDGVINNNSCRPYVTKWEDFEFLPGVAEAVKLLNRKDIPVIVISNQSCVGKGLISRVELDNINSRMAEELSKKGAKLLDIFVCPHTDEDGCDCRKPKPGLLLQAAKKHGIDIAGSWFIGDSDIDVEAGIRAGCRTYLLTKGTRLKDAVLEILKKF